ncbi:MAG: NAD(P)/FAD-dependent oxidoreductase [Chitinispirillaceae bacterium]|jgi:L-2-hydroxyglutarate oxidase LhgO|nr:NAD(P)/FAD-dependent oxidoreductase [Chitinispirillaceae bacterium]
MEHTDIVIIGAGAVGLAIADRLASNTQSVVVLERNDSFGRETSSRNSEVIHAGFYYPEGSLKAQLCVQGNPLMYDFCGVNNVPHQRCGKLVVARNPDDEKEIQHLFDQGIKNGVPELALLDKKEMLALEPAILGRLALLSQSTGIFNTHAMMQVLEKRASSKGALFAYNCTATKITRIADGYQVTANDADGSDVIIQCALVMNSAGLAADTVAAAAGIDIDQAGYKIHFCKGEYFRVSNCHRGKLSRLVYPAPTPISLGVHGVLGLDGSFRVGPNAFYVDTIDYAVDPAHGDEFFADAQSLFPFITRDDLTPDQSGIRPKLQADGEPFADWIIRDEAKRGLPGLVNLIGIESPGLTSCFAIAQYVEKIIAA